MSIWKDRKINPFEVAMDEYENTTESNDDVKSRISENLNKNIDIPTNVNYRKIINDKSYRKRSGGQISIYLSDEANNMLEEYSALINKPKSRIIDELIKQTLK